MRICLGSGSSTAGGGRPPKHAAHDFVVALPSTPERYLLAQATRAWRLGLRTFIAINNTEDVGPMNAANEAPFLERYECFPDEGNGGDLGARAHGTKEGDTRAALAPFLAYRHYGDTFKWMLYGDDDTLFYMPGVQRLLDKFDPELPLAITDHLWYREQHPNLFAPRCLPCHMANASEGLLPTPAEAVEGYSSFLLGLKVKEPNHEAKVAMRRRSSIWTDFEQAQAEYARHGPDASIPGVRQVPRPACPSCTPEAACAPAPPPGVSCRHAAAHGGAGVILSIGLFRKLPLELFRECVLSRFGAPGGDDLLSGCLWQHGVAFTDPGSAVVHGFDASYVGFSSEAGKWALHDPVAALKMGKCDARCRWLLHNAVSLHLKGRHFASFHQSAAQMYDVGAMYTAAHAWLSFMETRKARQQQQQQQPPQLLRQQHLGAAAAAAAGVAVGGPAAASGASLSAAAAQREEEQEARQGGGLRQPHSGGEGGRRGGTLEEEGGAGDGGGGGGSVRRQLLFGSEAQPASGAFLGGSWLA